MCLLVDRNEWQTECGQFSRLRFDKYVNSSMTPRRSLPDKALFMLISTFDRHCNAELAACLLIFITITSFQVRILETETLLRRNKELIRNGVTIVGEFIVVLLV